MDYFQDNYGGGYFADHGFNYVTDSDFAQSLNNKEIRIQRITPPDVPHMYPRIIQGAETVKQDTGTSTFYFPAPLPLDPGPPEIPGPLGVPGTIEGQKTAPVTTVVPSPAPGTTPAPAPAAGGTNWLLIGGIALAAYLVFGK